MSKKSKLKQEVAKAIRCWSGSNKTRNDYYHMGDAFAEKLWLLGYQIQTVNSLKVKHLQAYCDQRLEEGINRRSIQNEMAVIRLILRHHKRAAFANSEQISNSALGLGDTDRQGTKIPLADHQFDRVYQHALRLDRGIAAILVLMRFVGLRSQEGIVSCKSLESWVISIEAGHNYVIVIHGTKGGRRRQTTLHNPKAITAIKFALEVAKSQNNVLITRKGLNRARDYFYRCMKKLGLVGPHASHCLRYAYAREAVEKYISMGFTADEAKAMTAVDLGHGSTRGRLVDEVYYNLKHLKKFSSKFNDKKELSPPGFAI